MSLVAFFVANKNLDFVGNQIHFDASESVGEITSYAWAMDDVVPIELTTIASATHVYQNYGSRKPSLIVYSGLSASDEYYLSADLDINPRPQIEISGLPRVNTELLFTDHNAPFYIPDSISRIWFDFGDGSAIVSGDVDDNFYHTYSTIGDMNVFLSAIDISGNTALDGQTIRILDGQNYIEKEDYISLCGPSTIRLAPDKLINLVDFLPDYLQETDIYDLIKFYEDFLNEMYSGINGLEMTETAINTSASEIRFSIPEENLSDDPRISILEKIKRLSELHDPNLIDIEYIQFFAKYLGYNIDINRTEIGGFGAFDSDSTVCSAAESEKYMRFVVENFPNWYKIKTTKNMVQIMLYSFGLIGDIAQYYTKPIAQGGYDENMVNWKIDIDDDLTGIPKSWFPTPHYSIVIDIDKSIEDNPDNTNILNLLITQGDRMIKAIESMRPINTVFHRLSAKTTESMDIYAGVQTRFSRYIRVDNDGYADSWYVINADFGWYDGGTSAIDSPEVYQENQPIYFIDRSSHATSYDIDWGDETAHDTSVSASHIYAEEYWDIPLTITLIINGGVSQKEKTIKIKSSAAPFYVQEVMYEEGEGADMDVQETTSSADAVILEVT